MALDLARLTQSDWIQRLEYHQSLTSTNDRAAALAAEEFLACPALVVAAEQTAGRGRGGNRWWSGPGALMFSLVVDESARFGSPWSGYSLAAGLAIAEALAELHPQFEFLVKWPNDVYANERKICGILIESPAAARGRLIVGIGVNVNNTFASAPAELAASATSLQDLTRGPQDATATLLRVLATLETRWSQLPAAGLATIREAWQARSLLTGRTVELQSGHQRYIGRCLGIDEQGALLLQLETGPQAFLSGSILNFDRL